MNETNAPTMNTPTMNTPEKVIVTRHPALVDLLIERGCITEEDRARVREHVTAEDVQGKHVFGVLPLDLAARAAWVTHVPLALTPADRGQELSLERLRTIAGPTRTYRVYQLRSPLP